MQLHSPQRNDMHSGHIAKLDRTSTVPHCTTCFQAFGCIPHTFTANALSHPFRLGDFNFFWCLSLRWPFPCGSCFAAKPLSLYNLFRRRISFTLDSAVLSEGRSWFFAVDLCSDVASLLHLPAATFTALCKYQEDSPGYE
jgi:hypothetical protein